MKAKDLTLPARAVRRGYVPKGGGLRVEPTRTAVRNLHRQLEGLRASKATPLERQRESRLLVEKARRSLELCAQKATAEFAAMQQTLRAMHQRVNDYERAIGPLTAARIVRQADALAASSATAAVKDFEEAVERGDIERLLVHATIGENVDVARRALAALLSPSDWSHLCAEAPAITAAHLAAMDALDGVRDLATVEDAADVEDKLEDPVEMLEVAARGYGRRLSDVLDRAVPTFLRSIAEPRPPEPEVDESSWKRRLEVAGIVKPTEEVLP